MRSLKKLGASIVFFILAFCCCRSSAAAQNSGGEQTRDITVESLVQEGGDTVFVFKNKAKTKFKRKAVKPMAKPISTRPTIKETRPPMVWKQLGVTIWKLDSTSTQVNDGQTARMLVQEEGTNKEYTPKRVETETLFQPGDRVRLSFESSARGYLYVFDREIYADGKVGEPWQIFPTMSARGGDNVITVGSLIDIPAQTDRTPYFELQKKGDGKWKGELLTVIVSPEPLPDIAAPKGPSPFSAAILKELEDKYLRDSERFEQVGSVGTSYTKAEKEAGGAGSRQLTQNDPLPQTFYRVKARSKEPMMINLSLSVK